MTLTSKLTLIASRCREIIALAERASAAPWTVDPYESSGVTQWCVESSDDSLISEVVCIRETDADFIAASRTLTPALARGILAVIEWNMPFLANVTNLAALNAEVTLKAIADSFIGEGWE